MLSNTESYYLSARARYLLAKQLLGGGTIRLVCPVKKIQLFNMDALPTNKLYASRWKTITGMLGFQSLS